MKIIKEEVLRIDDKLYSLKDAEDLVINSIGEFVDGLNKCEINIKNFSGNKNEKKRLDLNYWQLVTLVYALMDNSNEIITLLQNYNDVIDSINEVKSD